MFDPSSAAPELAALPMSELASRRARLAADLEAAEARWVEAAERLEQAAA
jgi:ATP-binding cassette subfamily F protein 3